MVIWRDVGVRIFHKCIHVRRIGGRVRNAFIVDCGDLPVMHWNEVTKQPEAVVNPRGRAYAARRRAAYRRNKKKDSYGTVPQH
jgi:hypothetical protein